MKKSVLSALWITLISGLLISLNADEISWLDTLQAELSHKFKSNIRRSQVENVDHLERKPFQATRFEGEGFLRENADPFKTLTDFFVVRGWMEDWRYLADKHGGTSTAYRKGKYFCITSVDVDSSDDDEFEGHIPSRYWISLVCREVKIVRP